ncbi:MAG: InlB B-repeat-containing protein [Alphaproteobacteria bacterium]|nr:InlB B-repeat-containing protein [Alphaproteobacteria bacterium]
MAFVLFSATVVAESVGYTIDAEDQSADCSGATINNVEPGDRVAYKAQWEANQYIIAYDGGTTGGTSSVSGNTNSQTVTFDDINISLQNCDFSAPGYHFTGWESPVNLTNGDLPASPATYVLYQGSQSSLPNGDYTGGTLASYGYDSSSATPANTVTLTAQWMPNQYSVTYDANTANGGAYASGYNAPTVFGPGTSVGGAVYDAVWTTQSATAAHVEAQSGYTFNGWNTSPDGTGTSYVANAQQSAWTGLSDLTLYAVYVSNPVTIRFDCNYPQDASTMADRTGPSPDSQTINMGASGVLNSSCTLPGYTFNGWKCTSGLSDSTDTAYTLTEGRTLPISNGTTVYIHNANGVTCYGDWETSKYNINYWSGAHGTADPDPYVAANALTFGQNWTTATLNETGITADAGYTFDHWNTMADDSGTTYSAGVSQSAWATDAGLTLYAIYTPDDHTISYECGEKTFFDGEEYITATDNTVIADTTVYTDGSYTLSDNACNLDGYDFAGWSCPGLPGEPTLPADADEKIYFAEHATGTYSYDSNVICTAQWTPKHYKVTYHRGANAADGVQDYVDQYNADTGIGGATYGENYTVLQGGVATADPNIYAAGGYTFVGWSTEPDATVANFSGEILWTSTNNLEVYAIYTPNKINITYDCNVPDDTSMSSGSTPNAQSVDMDGQATLNGDGETCGVAGYDFQGWSCPGLTIRENGVDGDEANAEHIFNFGDQFSMHNANGVKCSAVWSKLKYSVTYKPGDHAAENALNYEDANIEYKSTYAVKSNTEVSISPDTGFVFQNWECDNELGNKDAGDEITMPAGNVECTAIWNCAAKGYNWNNTNHDQCVPIEYNITYVDEEGDAITSFRETTGKSHPATYNITDIISVAAVNPEGDYTFAGWCEIEDVEESGTTLSCPVGTSAQLNYTINATAEDFDLRDITLLANMTQKGCAEGEVFGANPLKSLKRQSYTSYKAQDSKDHTDGTLNITYSEFVANNWLLWYENQGYVKGISQCVQSKTSVSNSSEYSCECKAVGYKAENSAMNHVRNTNFVETGNSYNTYDLCERDCASSCATETTQSMLNKNRFLDSLFSAKEKCVEPEYHVNFDCDGGTAVAGGPADQKYKDFFIGVISGDSYQFAPVNKVCACPQYTEFAGWNCSVGGANSNSVKSNFYEDEGSIENYNFNADLNCTAVCEGVTRTLQYECGDDATGNAPASVSVVYPYTTTVAGGAGSCAVTGKTFAGTWACKGETYGAEDLITLDDDTTTCTANWTDNKYTVVYSCGNDAEGTPPTDENEYLYGERVTVKPNVENGEAKCVRYGYDIKKWNCDNGVGLKGVNGTATFLMPDAPNTDDARTVTCTADWGEDEYRIIYHLDNGTVSPQNPTTYTINTETFTLNNPTKTGYEFLGWCTADVDFDENNASCSQTQTVAQGTTGDLEFWARFAAKKYQIKYYYIDANNQEQELTGLTPSKYTYGTKTYYAQNTSTQTIEIPTGVFLGWYYQKSNLGSNPVVPYARRTIGLGETVEPTYGDVKLYADVRTCSAAFPLFDMEVQKCYKKCEQKPQAKEISGKHYQDSNTCVYTYQIVYNDNGHGMWPDGATENPNKTSYTWAERNSLNTTGKLVRMVPRPTETTYSFEGWYLDSGFTQKVTSLPNKPEGGTINLYAKWNPCQFGYTEESPDNCEPIVWRITYEMDGGALRNGETNPSTYTIEDVNDTEVRNMQILKEPKKDHYNFKGWYDNANYSGEAVTYVPAGRTGDFTLWAKWEPAEYVTFYCNNQEYTKYGEIGEIVQSPEESGDEESCNRTEEDKGVFWGWRCWDGHSELSTVGEQYPLNGARTLPFEIPAGGKYCKAIIDMSEVPFSITYVAITPQGESRDTSTLTPTTFRPGHPETYPTNPQFDGYRFFGWYNCNNDVCERSDFVPANKVTQTPQRAQDQVVYAYLRDGCSDTEYTVGNNCYPCPTNYPHADDDATSMGDCYRPCAEQFGYITQEPGKLYYRNKALINYNGEDYYCKYEPESYSINYRDTVTRGDDEDANLVGSATYSYGEDVSLMDYSVPGYKFLGWCEGVQTCETPLNVRVAQKNWSGNKTLYAQLTPRDFNIVYMDGNQRIDTFDTHYYTYKVTENVSLPETYAKTGYVFHGWKTVDNNYITGWSAGEAPADTNGTVTVYADLEAYTYNVKYYCNENDDEYKANDSVAFDESYTYATKTNGADWCDFDDGYEFDKWECKYDNNTFNVDGDSVNKWNILDDVNCYAVPKAAPYTITYMDSTSEIFGLEPVKYTMVENVSLPTKTDVERKVAKPGYEFIGWKDTADEDISGWIAGGKHGKLTFFAQWNCTENYHWNAENTLCVPDGWSITYKYQNNILTGLSPESYVYGEGATLPDNPGVTHDSYKFAGWCTGYNEETGEYSGCGATSVAADDTGDKVFYATWEFVCESGKWLHAGEDKICLYDKKEADLPAIRIETAKGTSYMLLKEDADLPINSRSQKKFHVQKDANTLYNAYDKSVEKW